MSSSKSSICVTFLSDAKYFDKFVETCTQLIQRGQYLATRGGSGSSSDQRRDICLIIDDSLHELEIYNHPFLLENKIVVKYFPNIKFSDNFHSIARHCDRYNKIIQYHKFYLFDQFFKKWDYIFYMDAGMQIKSPIQPILDVLKPDCFYAHSDSYHEYKWALERQFFNIGGYLEKLRQHMDLNIDYFQTTILIFDTRKYIRDNVVERLIDLTEEFPNSNTNEQGIMSIYFSKVWQQIPMFVPNKPYIRLYDFMPRFPPYTYIMYKYDFNMTSPITIDPATTGKIPANARVKPRLEM
jgi:hypothetical protein